MSEQRAYTRAYNNMRHRERRKGRELGLTRAQAAELFAKPCHYCGYSGKRKVRFDGILRVTYCNGIDRVDSSIGYTPHNTVPCCRTCNIAKSDLTVEQFKGWWHRLATWINAV